MSDVSAFEARRFRTAAAHYLSGRPAYSPRLISRVVQLCGLTRRDRVIDLGCGPGQLAIAFAPYVGNVIGIDPEPEMLRLARQATQPNIEWREGSSRDLDTSLAPCRLVAMGRSFHWMDRADTLRRLDGIVAPDGAVALFHDSHPDLAENDWRQEFRALLATYSGDDAQRRARRAPGWAPHTAILLESAFSDIEEISVIERRTTSAAALVDRALSMSSTSRARLGGRTDDLLRDLETLLQRLAPHGTVTEVVATYALIARRN